MVMAPDNAIFSDDGHGHSELEVSRQVTQGDITDFEWD